MPFEWVADHDPFPPKKKGGSSRRQTLRPTSGKKSATVKVPEFASNEEPSPAYLEYLRMKGYLGGNNHGVGSSEPNVGGLSHNNNEREQPVGGKSIDKSAEENVGDEKVNNGAAINDPQYKSFLENLRVDGSGGFYVEVEPHSGLRGPLRYEPERGRTKPIKAQRRPEPPSERENDAVLEVQDSARDGNGISENISRQRKRRENGNAKRMKNISGEGKRFMDFYTVTEGTSEELCEEVEANGQTKLGHENVTYQRTKTRKTEKRVEPSPERENDGVIEILNSADDGESKSDKISRRRKRRENNKEKFLKNKSRKRKRVMSSSKTTEGSNGKDSRVVPWDDSYLAFMLCLRGDGDLCIYTSSNDKQVKYPAEEEVDAESSSSDVEILSPEDVSRFETDMGFVITRTIIETGVDMTPPVLREKIIAELKRPYDRTEYDNLLKEFEIRKPQAKCRQLRRSRDVVYETNVTCRSYLEMHPVLGRKLKQVDGNAPATLNLLRGFFFWLKHVPYDMFQPWTDPECLSILPLATADDAPTLPPPDASTAIHPFKGKKRTKKGTIEWY